jgi:hypothetical protein
MKTKKKNPAAVSLGRLGGLVRSDAKKRAAKQRVLKRLAAYRAQRGGVK